MFNSFIYLHNKTKQQKRFNKKEADLTGENQKTPRASEKSYNIQK